MKSSDINPYDYRVPEHPIEPLLLKRWSPRAMTGETINNKLLMSLFEAARWAPSSGNVQNWHYFFALKSSTEFEFFSPSSMQAIRNGVIRRLHWL